MTHDIRKADIQQFICEAGFANKYPDDGYCGPPNCCIIAYVAGVFSKSRFTELENNLRKHFGPVFITTESNVRDRVTYLYIYPKTTEEEDDECIRIRKEEGGYEYMRDGEWLPASWSEHLKVVARAKLSAMTESELDALMAHLEKTSKLWWHWDSQTGHAFDWHMEFSVEDVEPDDLKGLL